MAPIAIADLESGSNSGETDVGLSVFPPPNANIRLKKLWAQHGDIQSPMSVDRSEFSAKTNGLEDILIQI